MKTPKRPPPSPRRPARTPARARRLRSAVAADIVGGTTRAARDSGGIIPVRWRWHYQVLLALQDRLARQRGLLRQAAAEPIEPHSLDEADSATDEFDHDLALAELSADADALNEIGQALDRIRTGRYGVCEESGRAIPAARLKAVPWTRFTKDVEERLERKGRVPRAQVTRPRSVRAHDQVWLGPEEEPEELAESSPAPAKDEGLSHVYSPPGRHARPQPRPRTSRVARKGKKT